MTRVVRSLVIVSESEKERRFVYVAITARIARFAFL